jgi:hypothetical protein
MPWIRADVSVQSPGKRRHEPGRTVEWWQIACRVYTLYIHLGQIGGRWQVVNALGYRTPSS